MEIRYIREFLAIAETKSYTEASERMFVTASSLSRHIRTLENELGAPLFQLNAHKVVLTRSGEMFLPFAREILHVDDAFSAAFANADDCPGTTVTLGSILLMRAYRITDLITGFQLENKSVRLIIREAYSSSLVSGLRNGELDLAFLRDRDDPDGEFDKILFAKDRLCALLPRTHALASKDAVDISMLREEPLLMIGKNEFLYKLCSDLCLNAGFEPRIRFLSHHADSLIEMVSKGMGIGLLMRKPAAGQIPPDLLLVNIEPAAETTIYLARNVHHKLNRQARNLWEMAKQAEPSL